MCCVGYTPYTSGVKVHMISICIYARHGRGPVARWPLVVVLVPDNLRSGVVAGR